MRESSLLLALFLSLSCSTRIKEKSSFEDEHHRWQKERVEGLKSKSGWLNLAGLFWLEEGENTIGSDSSNSIIFPANAPGRIGKYMISGEEIRFIPNPSSGVNINGILSPEMEIQTDKTGNATLLEAGSLAWFIIERGGKFGIRLRDYEHPAIRSFHGIESFPADKQWRIRADFEKFDEPEEFMIPTVLGTEEKNICPGILRFKIGNIPQVLYPTFSGKGFFIVFGDETSGDETYGGGRFIYTAEPEKDGSVYIDFNRAYNPPCAYTPFATCPLPPRENILTVRIEAGEKFAGH